MPISLNPYAYETLATPELSPIERIAISAEACLQLAWSVVTVSPKKILASTGLSDSDSEKIIIEVIDDHLSIESSCRSLRFTGWNQNRENVKLFSEKFQHIQSTITSEQLVDQVNNLEQELSHNFLENETIDETVIDYNSASALKPSRNFFITPALILVNVGVYIAMVVSGVDFMDPEAEVMAKWGGNYRPLTLDGGWYRLVSSCFLHYGIIHLALNMIALLFVGSILERKIGTWRYLSAYILSGIVASVASVWWHVGAVSAGASGAVFGMYGVLAAFILANAVEFRKDKGILGSTLTFVGYNLVSGLSGEVDNAAHIGGLICGFIIGLYYSSNMLREQVRGKGVKVVAITSFVTLIFCSIAYTSISNDLPRYEEKMREFAINERMALEIYGMQNIDKEEAIFQVEERGLYYWGLNIKLLTETLELSLPSTLHAQSKKLITYCELRRKSYELILNGLKENSDRYETELQANEKKIEKFINELATE